MGSTRSTLPAIPQVQNLTQVGGIQHICITYYHQTNPILNLYDYQQNRQNNLKQNKIYITNDATLGILRNGLFCLLDFDFQIKVQTDQIMGIQKHSIINIQQNQVEKVIGRFRQYDNCYMWMSCMNKQSDKAWLVVNSLPVNFFPIQIGQTIRLGNIKINIQAIMNQSKDQNKDKHHEKTQSSEVSFKPDSQISLQIPQFSQSHHLSLISFKTLSIGSSSQCNICLPYPTISPFHCQLTYHKEMKTILISDLDSQFGTLIKVDKEIMVSVQNNGLQVQIGNDLIEMNVKRKQAQYQSPTYQQINRVFANQNYKQQRLNKIL